MNESAKYQDVGGRFCNGNSNFETWLESSDLDTEELFPTGSFIRVVIPKDSTGEIKNEARSGSNGMNRQLTT